MSKLFLVPTPIGNLEDITFRAIKILESVDLIAAEDTRHSKKLLNRYNIQTRLISCHEHNEAQKTELFLNHLKNGLNIALNQIYELLMIRFRPCDLGSGWQIGKLKS